MLFWLWCWAIYLFSKLRPLAFTHCNEIRNRRTCYKGGVMYMYGSFISLLFQNTGRLVGILVLLNEQYKKHYKLNSLRRIVNLFSLSIFKFIVVNYCPNKYLFWGKVYISNLSHFLTRQRHYSTRGIIYFALNKIYVSRI